MSDFNSLDLIPSILDALKNKGYTTPTPIQIQSIPHLLEGKDLLGIAQTGTGKTAAFALPILNRLAKNKIKMKPGRVRTLILTPTRELASQIEQNIISYGKGLNLSTKVVFGGVGKRPQVVAISRGLDILIATPGRLLDLMNEGHVRYDDLEVFVLDEADRMLDMGFIRDIQKIIAKLPVKKQTLLFSATMPSDIAKLASSLLKNPVKVEVTPQSTTVEKIEQKVYFLEKSNKPLLLKHILLDRSLKSILVFTRTKHGADRVVRHLENAAITSAAIHGNKSQGARERALGNFRDQKIRVLVATDIAARGIDVPHVSHVVNYDIPNDPESYVHRIGRTARAGRGGVAVSFCDPTEVSLLKSVEKLTKTKIDIDESHPFHGAPGQVSKHPPRNNNNSNQKRSFNRNNKKKSSSRM